MQKAALAAARPSATIDIAKDLAEMLLTSLFIMIVISFVGKGPYSKYSDE